MKFLSIFAWVLVLIGAINWGLIGFFQWNLVNSLFGNSMVERVIYDIVGLSGVWLIIRSKCFCSAACGSGKKK